MTGIVIDEVNVVVSGMVPDKTTSDIDLTIFFQKIMVIKSEFKSTSNAGKRL